jgi:hypothetical protein
VPPPSRVCRRLTASSRDLPARGEPRRHRRPDRPPVGERLWRDGAAGILSPSAAHQGHTVLTVFRTGPDVPGVVEANPVTVHDVIPKIPTGLRT